jgi:hypothetical protein
VKGQMLKFWLAKPMGDEKNFNNQIVCKKFGREGSSIFFKPIFLGNKVGNQKSLENEISRKNL